MSMNCHDVLGWLETGRPLQRWRAARHSAAARNAGRPNGRSPNGRGELAAAPPLSADLRQRWLDAAESPVETVPTPRRNSHRAVWLSAAIAATLLLGVGIAVEVFRSREHADHPNLPQVVIDDHGSDRKVGPITITAVDPATEFARIDEQLAQIQADVVGLSQDAQRLMAEQQIARLLADPRNWLAASETRPPISP